ncbi:OsmC family protein [Coraliomargarita akajimensis]|uniref:OsmC family protein n=1 Tax=Coraliomargarita akajimensis (strain DSM 45221 / IAM 15411 / JCM 23193 / KCTC 12865 / 04OKA010-24) TaxID=583355 RepID=D5ELG7_CORAD|nr:OsmC family protein [Coraliomargarita akajimensis]ADE55103.1 OsmC family protein [Coraliomargarita akajimensis DSM 45221]
MVKVSIDYEGELHCSVAHGPSSAVVHTDAPVDNNGKGESFSPTDLCASALGSCIATIVGMRLQAVGVEMAGMRLEVSKEMSADLPRRIVKLSTEVWIPCALSDEQKAMVENAAATCPVHYSLNPEIDKPIIFHWA